MVAMEQADASSHYVLAFDTANEVIALGLGVLHPETKTVELLAAKEIAAHRASNTQLIPQIDALMAECGIAQSSLAAIVCGRGPGSFTGVRICMSTAKGIASALHIGLVAVSTLDAIAWANWADGIRGTLAVLADAMRKEVYPLRYSIDDEGIKRLDNDASVKADLAAAELEESCPAIDYVCGDALEKYASLYEHIAPSVEKQLWTPQGRGLLLALQDWWRKGIVDPLDATLHNPAFALPVYTRLSDAEEAERVRCGLEAKPKNLQTGVQAERVEIPESADGVVAGMELKVDKLCEQETCTKQLNDLSRPLILALESSCDETAAALIDGEGTVLASVVASQIDFHARFGGVVPEIASRKHIEAICGVCDECFEVAAQNAGVAALNWEDLDSVAVTYAPGLVGALVVGVAFAKGAAWALQLPFIGVNHLEGHLYANKLANPDIEPPMVVSLVSGGNTMLVHVKDWGVYETLGSTLDDAVGEAFDKVAKALGLGYPGGPIISKYAAEGNPRAIAFPRAMLHSGDFQFSLSGLKTAVVNYIHTETQAGRELNIPDIAASFQAAVVDVQVAKAQAALKHTGAKEFCLGGGVAANPALRSAYEQLCKKMKVTLTLPPMSVCGDNAAMISLVALERYRAGKFFDLSADACAHTNLDDPY